jgi:hypothetical protein
MASDHRRLEALNQVLEAFNRHDLDATMAHFADDCVFDPPRGADPWGRRFVGKMRAMLIARVLLTAMQPGRPHERL